MIYRPEVDGLRALAVVPVILFHAGFDAFGGGFVGVDVFFVISGYLITTILINEMDSGRFSLLAFYERRARRILPALFFVTLVCIPFSWVWMTPEQMKDFAQSVIAVLLFASNILFFLEVDYFALAAEEKPLLHTWSLAIEEQYYVFFPLVLLVLWRMGWRLAFATLLFLSFASLILSQITSSYNQAANFFLLPFRIWELGMGSLCAVFATRFGRKGNDLAGAIGIAMIAASIVLFDKTTPFPSLFALLPTVGTALILLCADRSNRTGQLLALKPLVGIGLISYSAYLWHQPLFAFARIRLGEELTTEILLLLCIVTIALAWTSWKFVEMPFRRPRAKILKIRRILVGTVCVVTFMLSFGLAGHIGDGIPERFSREVRAVLDARNDKGIFRECLHGGRLKGAEDTPTCILGEAGKPDIDFLLVGDSYAAVLATGLSLAAKREGQRGATYLVSSCPPIPGVGGGFHLSMKVCEQVQNDIIDTALAVGVRQIFLVSSWRVLNDDKICTLSKSNCDQNSPAEAASRAQRALGEMVAEFRDRGINVRVIGNPPRAKGIVPFLLASRLIQGRSPHLSVPYEDIYPDRVATWLEDLGYSDVYFDISSQFCDSETCILSKNAIPLIRDQGHLTATASRDLSTYLQRLFRPENGI